MDSEDAQLGCNCVIVLAVLVFWIAVGVIAAHFILKWW